MPFLLCVMSERWTCGDGVNRILPLLFLSLGVFLYINNSQWPVVMEEMSIIDIVFLVRR